MAEVKKKHSSWAIDNRASLKMKNPGQIGNQMRH